MGVTPRCKPEPRQANATPAGSTALLTLFQPKIEKKKTKKSQLHAVDSNETGGVGP